MKHTRSLTARMPRDIFPLWRPDSYLKQISEDVRSWLLAGGAWLVVQIQVSVVLIIFYDNYLIAYLSLPPEILFYFIES